MIQSETEPEDFEDKIIQNPYIKITKNTKGYNYSFKCLSNDLEEIDKLHTDIEKLIKIWNNRDQELKKLELEYDRRENGEA